MLEKRLKMLQDKFPVLDLAQAKAWIQDAYNFELNKESGVITSYTIDSAFAHLLEEEEQLACYDEGKKLAKEFKSTRLYKELNDG